MNGKLRGNIAIDGPAGAGKSTVARLLAHKLKYQYIDTGAMYRALTWKAVQRGIDFDDEQQLTALARSTKIFIDNNKDEEPVIYCDGEDITTAIRSPQISRLVSSVAQKAGVRYYLVKLQRRMAVSNRVVMDGRDIGTYVLPDAPYKYYLTASLDERARRRRSELAVNGRLPDLEKIKEEIYRRDTQDSQRQITPMKPAKDAIIIDTSNMNIEAVVARLLYLIKKQGGLK